MGLYISSISELNLYLGLLRIFAESCHPIYGGSFTKTLRNRLNGGG